MLGKCQAEFTGSREADESASADAQCEKLADHLGARGTILTIATACAASTNAIGVGRDELWRGEADLVLVGGIDTLLPGTVQGFNAMQALSKGPCAPYTRSDGLTVGEGAAFLVLERLADATRRGARVRAEVLGYGLSADTYHITAPDPMGRGPILAVTRALRDAGLTVNDIDYVNGHGTGTPANDSMERRVMRSLFGDRARPVPISSTKSIVGHTLGAAGALEAVTCVLALENGIIPPTLNGPDDVADNALDCVAHTPRPAPLRAVLSNSYAFGGNNAAVVLGRAGRSSRPTTARAPSSVVVTGLGVVGSLGIGIDDWRKALGRPQAAFHPIRSFDPTPYPCHHTAEIDPRFDTMAFAKPRDWRHMDPISRQSVAAVRLALDDARLRPSSATSIDIGVFFGTATGPASTSYAALGRGGSAKNPHSFAHSSLNTPAGLVCQTLGLRGPTTTICSGGVSGTLAVHAAARAIHLGQADVVVVVAADEFSELVHRSSTRFGRLASDGTVRPYDVDRAGTVLGEAAVAIVLESREAAAARDALPYCDVRGYAHGVIEHDAARMLQAGGYIHTVETALARSGAALDSVDYCVGAAAGEPFDSIELTAVEQTLPAGVTLSAPKSITGDCRAGSGALNIVVAALAISDGLVTPTINLRQPVPSRSVVHAGTGTPVRGSTTVALDFWRERSFCATVLGRPEEGARREHGDHSV